MTAVRVPVSAAFRAEARKAILAIFYFFVVYAALTLFAGCIAAICIYLGIGALRLYPLLFTVIIGLGLIALGLLVVFFQIKFIFANRQTGRPYLREIERAQEPRFFQLLDELAEQVGTRPPKRVYLSGEVNASVFYDAIFWSMFFPVRKNLRIGLGLINTMTVSELQAILAHEFGHFSQRSMLICSYVYHVNQALNNLLYENDAYDRFVSRLANLGWVFSLFALLAINIVKLSQTILRAVYRTVNNRYLALSRQMEFHADAVAVAVVGSEPAQSGLLRSNSAEYALDNVEIFYRQPVAETSASSDIYAEQHYILNWLAQQDGVPIVNDLPRIDLAYLARFKTTDIVLDNQWTTHPELGERIQRMADLDAPSVPLDNARAKTLLEQWEDHQRFFTQFFNSWLNKPENAAVLPFATFTAQYVQAVEQSGDPRIFKDYYEYRKLSAAQQTVLDTTGEVDVPATIEELFSDELIALAKQQIVLENDCETLEAIRDEQIDVPSFDYRGQKWPADRAGELLTSVTRELSLVRATLLEKDRTIYRYFQQLEAHSADESQLQTYYERIISFDQRAEERYGLYQEIRAALSFVYQTTPNTVIRSNFLKLAHREKKLKAYLEELLADTDAAALIEAEEADTLRKYLAREWIYFRYDEYYEENLDILFRSLDIFAAVLVRRYQSYRKELLRYQADLYQAYSVKTVVVDPLESA